jgi:L-fucose isomerase-like protein
MEQKPKTVLLFGGEHSRYLREWEITSDLALAERVMDVRFCSVSTEELMARYESLSAEDQKSANGLARDLLDGASVRQDRMPRPPDLAQVAQAAQLYVAMRHYVDENAAQAVTIICGPWIRGEGRPTPCMALMLFQEAGIPAACQSDIDALLTMILFKRLAGKPSFMGGAIKARGKLGINHCMLCRNMTGVDDALQPYVVSTYHGRKETPTVWTQVPVGERVTVARLTRNLEQLLLLAGTVVASDTHNTRCRNTLVVDVPDRNRVFRAVKGIQHHYVVACGDHVQALSNWAGDRGIDVVRLDME